MPAPEGAGHQKGRSKAKSDAELLALPKVKPEDAARYLQSGHTAQEIRVKAQLGLCPFCNAYKPTGRRYVYRINIGLLQACKRGELAVW